MNIKILLLSIILASVGVLSQAQITNTPPPPKKAVEMNSDKWAVMASKPAYPGNLSQDISKNLEYPSEAQDAEISGVVRMKFVVEVDGTITHIEAESYPAGGEMLVTEAKRVIKKLKRFEPALDQHGKPVRSKFLLPIRFQLSE